MFKLLRYYSITSFVAIIVAAVMLSLFYRQVAFHGIFHLAEKSNQSLARIALHSMTPALIDYLNSVAHEGSEGVKRFPLPAELAASIDDLMQAGSVVRVKICNRRGVVAFSTEADQIGEDLSRSSHFISAINGMVTSSLIYRDTFNIFQDATQEDNLMQTYMPVRASPTEPIVGLFEIYTDANNLVYQNDRIEFLIIVGAILILSALYVVLVLAVRRARDIIEEQQRTIRERTQTLEILAAQMLDSEESYKKKIAIELHEGLAQTLSAIKLNVEIAEQAMRKDDALPHSMEAVIPELQNVIQEVRALATELRPSTLDDFGLLPTIHWLCRGFEQRHPSIRVNQQISVQEEDVPAPLKAILFRIATLALNDIEQHTKSERILVALMRTRDNLALTIDNTPAIAPEIATGEFPGSDLQQQPRFARMRELATLSGGTFKATRNSAGGTILQASWVC